MNIDSRLNQRQGITQMTTRIRPAYLAALTVALGLFLASHAFATVQPNTPTPVATANADASAGAVATSNSGSFSTASTGPSNANANNAISITDRLQAPAVGAAPIFASGPCVVAASGGVSGPGFGIAGGKAKIDPDCNLREMVRILTALNPRIALKLACTDPAVKAVAGDCELPPTPAPQPCAVCVPRETSDSYSKSETDERIERAFKGSISK
jgi:hypothetical protein